MTDTNPAPPPAPTFDYAKWEAERAREADLTAQVVSQNKAALFDVLAAANIATVVVVFDGYGDSGQIENIEAKVRAREGIIDISAQGARYSDYVSVFFFSNLTAMMGVIFLRPFIIRLISDLLT